MYEKFYVHILVFLDDRYEWSPESEKVLDEVRESPGGEEVLGRVRGEPPLREWWVWGLGVSEGGRQ